MSSQTASRIVLAKFAGTCKACNGAIKNGDRLLPSQTLTGAKGKAAFIHVACAEKESAGQPATNAAPVVQTAPAPAAHVYSASAPSELSVAKPITRQEFIKLLDEVMPTYDWDVDVSGDIKPINDKVNNVSTLVHHQLEEFRTQLNKVATFRTGGTSKIEVEVAKTPKVTLKEVPNAAFQKVLTLAANRMNIMLVGPTGSGKTHLAATIAKCLKLDFSFLSCSAGMSEGHLLGRMLPTGKGGSFEYHRSEFVRLYEEGGVMLLDEVDAGDNNVMLVINSAISNDVMSVPSRTKKPVAKRHKDFVLICAANTYGRGADRLYVGRNQLDEATLDRFRIGMVEVDYDQNVEASLCPNDELRTKLLTMRERIQTHGMKRFVSTRFMRDAHKMTLAGFTWQDVFTACTKGWTRDELAKMSDLV